MSKRDWRLFLMEIIESIKKIDEYIKDINYEQFLCDSKTQDAVVRNLEIIGEAANRIPKEIKEKYDDVPWNQIIGLRNRLIHGYFVVDFKIVWDIVINEIPDLKRKIKKILEEKQ